MNKDQFIEDKSEEENNEGEDFRRSIIEIKFDDKEQKEKEKEKEKKEENKDLDDNTNQNKKYKELSS